MRLRILILLALFAPSLAAAQNAETSAAVAVTMIEELTITALPVENILWEIEHSAQPEKAHEIFRDVTVLDGGDVVFAGQIGNENGNWEQSAFLALYDKSGVLKEQKLSALAGSQTVYDVHHYGDVLIAMGDYSEPQNNDDLWGGINQIDSDKIFIRLYDVGLHNMLHESYITQDEGSLYSARIIEHDGALYFKALLRNARMKESTALYALDVALNDGVYAVNPRKIGLYDGRSYDIAANAGDLYVAGHADEARLVKQPIGGTSEAKIWRTPSQEGSHQASNFSALMADGDKILVAGEWQGQNKREGILGVFDAAGHFNLQQHFSARDRALFSAKKLININDTVMAALYFIEPAAQDQTRYSVLMFLEKDTGALCHAYRIGDAQSNNILAYNGTSHDNALYIAGARAPKLSDRLSGSMLQKARFMAYNAYGMAINLNDLKMCP
jgi:hypothetical protein